MNIKNWFQFSWLRVGPDEPLELKSWRKWLVNVILFFTAFAMPLVMLVTFPVFIAEKQYGLIALDVIIWLIVIIGIFTKPVTDQGRAYLLLAILYTMTIIFFIVLGPHHARSGWLVMCSVMAAIMFGVYAAIVSATINTAALMLLYWLMGPENQAWAAEYTAPFSKWVMFVFNIFTITLASSLPVGFLLNRLDGSLNSERKTSGKLSVESEKLQTAYIALQDEIEERKQNEEMLKETQRYTRELIEASLDAFATITTDGKFNDVNNAAELITGMSREELIGTHFSKYFTNKDASIRVFRQCFRDGYSCDNLLEIEHRDGTIAPVLVNASVYKNKKGQIDGMFAAARNITNLKKAEEEIKKLSSAVEQSIDGIAIANLEPKLIYVNKAFAEMHGYTPEEIIGLKPVDIYGEKQIDEFISRLNQAKTEGSWMGEIAHIKKDGTPFPTRMSVTTLKDDDGKPTAFLAVTRDISEQKTLEGQLQQAQKMEAIGTLAGGIAHDFNNILSAISGNTEIALYYELPEEHPARQSMEQVLNASRRATDLVKQILAFSRQDEQELRQIRVTPIVKEALKLLRASLPATIEIRQNIAAEFNTVLGDPSQIHQVLMNLCTNASHAMGEEGGVLEVILQNADLEDNEKQSEIDLAQGHYLKLSVSDTGYGMERSVLERIFDPYFTTKTVEEGTGLGLAVVHGIIKSFGGMINVQSEPGKGTSFNVFLPVIKHEVKTEIDSSFGELPMGNEHILFIDDEDPLVEIGKRILERLGYKVTARTNSIEALELFRSQPEKFDLVITDMTMPNITGDKLSVELIKIRPDIPIILCTGFSELMTEEKAKSIGIKGLIMKPVVMRKIAQTIREALGIDD